MNPQTTPKNDTKNIVTTLKEAGQDYEYFPTTPKMLEVIYKDIRRATDQSAYSILEIGAGTGTAGVYLAGGGKVLAIEKSPMLRSQWNHSIIPVGTDFEYLSLIGIKADVCFCNPPYSAYEEWASKIISEFSGGQIYLVIPQRWTNSDRIKCALEERKAIHSVIFSGDFLDAERAARAKVDILRIDLRAGEYGSSRRVKVPSFALWYKKTFKAKPEQAQQPPSFEDILNNDSQLVAGKSYIDRIAALYDGELSDLEAAFKSIHDLSPNVFKLLNLSRTSLCDALQVEITGIRERYWSELFKKYRPISSRLTSYGIKVLKDKFFVQGAVDFSVDNILSATIWAIKCANNLYEKQLGVFVLQLFDKANVRMYKSNQRTFDDEKWRYSRADYKETASHYALEYRIILEDMFPFPHGEYFSSSFDYSNGLSKRCHDLVNDLLVIARNLGYESDGKDSYSIDWNPGKKYTFRLKNGEEAFTIRGYIKGTIHLQINTRIMRSINVEFGRLKGWIKNKHQAAQELGISESDAGDAWNSLTNILPSNSLLMLEM